MLCSSINRNNQYYTAAEWAKKNMEDWGVDKVYFENYCMIVWVFGKVKSI